MASDNHVGYEERDPIRKDDSWKTFDEIMNLARTEDVRLLPPFTLSPFLLPPSRLPGIL